MPPQTDFFNRPSFSATRDRRKKRARPSQDASSSSPLTEPPPSSLIDLTSESFGEKASGADTTENRVPSPTPAPSPTPLQKNSESSLPTNEAPQSSLNESFASSQRITKGGKERVKSSDGEDTESDDSFDGGDPALQYAHLLKPRAPPVVSAWKPVSMSPQKGKFSLDSLVSQAVEDQKVEAEIVQLRANFDNSRPKHNAKRDSNKKTLLREEMLTSALGNNDDDGGREAQRVIEAVRRTEALDQDKVWHFLDQTRTVMAVPPEFPKHLFPPGSNLGVLREPESRERAFQSGMLEFALSRGLLSDEFILWLFRAIPREPREELRQAYERVLIETKPARLANLIRPSDIDDLFLQIGAKPQALDLSKPIEADTPDHTYRESSLKNRAILLCIFSLLRQIAPLVTIDTLERAIHILLRITLDTSLMGDDLVRSELQRSLTALLETVERNDVEKMDRNICSTVYDTFGDVQFQSRMIQHILPTSDWISLLRCRLAMAFLLRSRDPLTEPVQEVLDLKRLTVLLMSDERFKAKPLRGRSNHDFGELIAVSVFLEVVINTSLIDLQNRNRAIDDEFNETVDKVCTQIKIIFTSIEGAGASHLKRMLAKEALELVHYRVVYSVRTQTPQTRRTVLADGDIRESMGKASDKARADKDKTSVTEKGYATATEDGYETPAMEKEGDTSMPLRPQRSDRDEVSA